MGASTRGTAGRSLGTTHCHTWPSGRTGAAAQPHAMRRGLRLRKGYGYHQWLDPGAMLLQEQDTASPRVARARRRWRPQPVHGGCDVQDRTRASIAHDTGDSNIFPVRGCSCAQDRRAPEGSTHAPTTFKLQEYHETTCVSDQQT